MSETIHLQTPLRAEDIQKLRAGDAVMLSGTIYTARDAAHKRLVEMLERGETMPFVFGGAAVFYAGPCPNRPGEVIGSIGPTTSGRMDAYSPTLMRQGLRVMIGKGNRNKAVVQAIRETGGVYLAAIGGIAALMSACVTEVRTIAFEDLGTEAIRELTVHELPLVVAIDSLGGSVYQEG